MQLVDAAPGQYKMLFQMAGYTGMRVGELCALRVEDLKLNDGVVEVSRTVWNGIEGPTKTKAGKRVVYLDSRNDPDASRSSRWQTNRASLSIARGDSTGEP